MKLKTHKALSKRIKITKNGKMIKQKAGKDHFNARESGKTRRNKRRDIQLTATVKRAVSTLMPNKN